MRKELAEGVYEHVLSEELGRAVDAHRERGWQVAVGESDEVLRPEILARYVYQAARGAFAAVPGGKDEKLPRQVELANRVLSVLREGAKSGAVLEEDAVREGARLLMEARAPRGDLGEALGTVRPHLALSESGLLVNGHRDYQIGVEVAREIESADGVDLLCAFVRFAGLRLVRRALERFVARGGTLRVIASVYTGSTEKRALDELCALGAKVKVSYETAQTRLHAKAWLFRRATGLSTAYIGSSNLTHTALVEGLEWNVRLSSGDNGALVERVSAAFEQYWSEPEFIDYSPERDGERLGRALSSQRGGERGSDIETLVALGIDFSPKPHQAGMLEALSAERDRGHMKNLVVAATGTGKTWVSAFDYQRLRGEGLERLLFVAHREEILRQSQQVFQLVLADPGFGERLVGGERPREGRHVFASVQSLARVVAELDPEAYDVVVVDEFHHAAADTYTALLSRLRPKVLVGLTATPERADGKSVLSWFDGRVASDLRLWDALDQGLLCPFHYFGVNDATDLSTVTFKRGRYLQAELENVYTGDDLRAQRVIQAVRDSVLDPTAMRALGFCVGVGHAQVMARRFCAAGLPAVALHADSPDAERRGAVTRLRRGELRAIFTVDLFNEGVDIPEVDTVLLLRPTESATVFLQQLGRGLRWAQGKSVLTVLDFIDQAHREYRFDVRYRALVGGTRRQLEHAIEGDFPLLPPGCAIRLDPIAKQRVLDNVRAAVRGSRRALLDDLRALGPRATLTELLRESGATLEDVYAHAGLKNTFTGLRRDLGFETSPVAPREDELGRALARMLHVDDRERIEAWLDVLGRGPRRTDINTREGRLALMLFAALGNRRRPIEELPEGLEEIRGASALRRELCELLALLGDRARTQPELIDAEGVVPLASHASYTLFEVMAAYGATGKKGSLVQLQTGVYFAEAHGTDLLFVTLEKSEAAFSPTTRYEDYPISRTRFHWESQNTTAERSKTGQRYIRGTSRVVLFVRERHKDGRGETLPYVCLGPVTYVSHEAERPMRIVWSLARPMPAWLYQVAKVAAG